MDEAGAIRKAYPQVSQELAVKIVQVARTVGTHPYNLANLINFESAHSFSAMKVNTVSGATGLIQFTPSTAKRLGTTTGALAAMGSLRQMDYVEKYLLAVKQGKWDDRKSGALGTPQALFMAVFHPWARDWNPSATFASRGWTRIPEQNPGIETPGDYMKMVAKHSKLPFVQPGMGWGWVAGGLVALVGAAFLGRRFL